MLSDQKMIIITAPSGAGKTTICRFLVDQIPVLEFSVSATSRSPRPHETMGKDYFFYSINEFREAIERGEFVEWEEVYENQLYGTLWSEVELAKNEGKVLLFDIDVNGAINLKKKFGDQALSIFIKPPSLEELKRRLVNRNTEDDVSLNKRLKRAEYELDQEKEFDVVIINDDLRIAQLRTLMAIKSFIGERGLEYEQE